ncbi:hypothetical protein M422DRAFT_257386 [Sphaerobolus stellatus SS14]|uniref:peptidylprolyl isomerase n=1 Tax=Sphaerobolus stellatus (strain SS14) TaxID=990650 RepID=A0A0C9VNX2_SPHS4|nr:hypothetical protein M422DRAFT_257386 [Sphaerobolus stellatus SS14]
MSSSHFITLILSPGSLQTYCQDIDGSLVNAAMTEDKPQRRTSRAFVKIAQLPHGSTPKDSELDDLKETLEFTSLCELIEGQSQCLTMNFPLPGGMGCVFTNVGDRTVHLMVLIESKTPTRIIPGLSVNKTPETSQQSADAASSSQQFSLISSGTSQLRFESLLDAFKAAPSSLTYFDIVLGSGTQAKLDSTVETKYTGTLTNGTVWGRPRNSVFIRLGDQSTASVVKGFQKGLHGIRRGGRRIIIIPPEEGYGASQLGNIPANSTLIIGI